MSWGSGSTWPHTLLIFAHGCYNFPHFDHSISGLLVPDLAALGDETKEWAVFDSGRVPPYVDPLHHPDRNGHGPDASSLAY